ncbi:Uncharacterized protein APZ42_020144 [Daphnia magna]|uniref:Uncharacterized protein n=1 Tax=Daphnia magna TaxID=35525 RepID=A0A164Y037_9CRUS|nr:Uncharacterized protein APZ42_020144 [Daphnia magna]
MYRNASIFGGGFDATMMVHLVHQAERENKTSSTLHPSSPTGWNIFPYVLYYASHLLPFDTNFGKF